MKVIKLFFTLFISTFLAIPLLSMEAPEPAKSKEVPLVLSAEYKKEEKKFRNLHIDNPKQALDLIATSLGKDKDINLYLKKLQLIASFLYLQDQALKNTLHSICIFDYNNRLNAARDTVAKYLELKPLPEGKYYHAPTDIDLIKEIFSNSHMIRSLMEAKASLNPEQLEYVKNLIKNPNPAVSVYGLFHLLNDHEITRTQEIKTDYDTVFQNYMKNVAGLFLKKTAGSSLSPLFEITQQFGQRIKELQERLQKLQKAKKRQLQQADFEQIEFFHIDNLRKITDLYTYTHHWYYQFYNLIRQEIEDTINAQRSKGATSPELSKVTKILLEKPVTDLPLMLAPYDSRCLALLSEFSGLAIMAQNFEQWKQMIKQQEQRAKIKKPRRRRIPHAKGAELPPMEQLKIEEAEIQEAAALETEKDIELKKELDKPQIMVGDDGSYIVQGDMTVKNIKIYDPKNNTIITLFKTVGQTKLNPRDFPPINYTDWVKSWFINPNRALKEQGYTDPNSKKWTAETKRWFPIVIHSFARLVDNFIFDLGIVTRVPNRRDPRRLDYLITIAGMMEFPDGTEEMGIFSYLIDSSNGQWYHRMFEPQSGTKIINDLFEKGYFSPEMSGYYDVFFPPLGKK